MMDASGGNGTLSITTQPECAWDVATNVNWISALAPASGQGTANVSFRVAPNEESSVRDGMIEVNGEQARVSQRAPCRYDVGPASQSIAATGGAGSLTITTANECAWTAVAEVVWISLSSPATGTGPGRVSFTVSPNQGEARSGSIAIASQRPSVTQAAVSVPAPPPPPPPACNATISPISQNISAAGGAGTPVTVSAGSTCQWSATPNVSWITVTAGATGSGNASVTFSVAANSGAARTGTLTIAGRVFTVTQAASSEPPPPSPPVPSPPAPSPPATCSYSISPTSLKVGRGASSATISVSAGATCRWTASSNTSWITVISGASGMGNGTVNFSYTRNEARGDRTGSLTVAGTTVSVEQNGPGGNNDD